MEACRAVGPRTDLSPRSAAAGPRKRVLELRGSTAFRRPSAPGRGRLRGGGGQTARAKRAKPEGGERRSARRVPEWPGTRPGSTGETCRTPSRLISRSVGRRRAWVEQFRDVDHAAAGSWAPPGPCSDVARTDLSSRCAAAGARRRARPAASVLPSLPVIAQRREAVSESGVGRGPDPRGPPVLWPASVHSRSDKSGPASRAQHGTRRAEPSRPRGLWPAPGSSEDQG